MEPLIAALKGNDRDAAAIIDAFGELNDARAIVPIVDALFSEGTPPWSSFHRACEHALIKIRDPATIHVLAERVNAQPKHPAATLALKILGDLVGEEFRHRPGVFAAWWEKENRRQ
ncbi:MAG: hypothetical protein QM811_24675 [Pirellulales bacterium]